MNRLTELNKSGAGYTTKPLVYQEEAIQRLAEYENAEENGKLLWLPCEVGTTVYEVSNNTDACGLDCNDFEKGYCMDDYCGKHDNCYFPQFADYPVCEKQYLEVISYQMKDIDMIYRHRNDFGVRIFFTSEEAETAKNAMISERTNRISCNKACDAKLEDCCMWVVDEKLIALAHDKEYKMCEYLRGEVLKRERGNQK